MCVSCLLDANLFSDASEVSQKTEQILEIPSVSKIFDQLFDLFKSVFHALLQKVGMFYMAA